MTHHHGEVPPCFERDCNKCPYKVCCKNRQMQEHVHGDPALGGVIYWLSGHVH